MEGQYYSSGLTKEFCCVSFSGNTSEYPKMSQVLGTQRYSCCHSEVTFLYTSIFIKVRELDRELGRKPRLVSGSKTTSAHPAGHYTMQNCSKQPEALEGSTCPPNESRGLSNRNVKGPSVPVALNPGLTSESSGGL